MHTQHSYTKRELSCSSNNAHFHIRSNLIFLWLAFTRTIICVWIITSARLKAEPFHTHTQGHFCGSTNTAPSPELQRERDRRFGLRCICGDLKFKRAPRHTPADRPSESVCVSSFPLKIQTPSGVCVERDATPAGGEKFPMHSHSSNEIFFIYIPLYILFGVGEKNCGRPRCTACAERFWYACFSFWSPRHNFSLSLRPPRD